MTTILLGPHRGVSVTMTAPWSGAPVFDVDLDPELPIVPSGRLPLKIDLAIVNGTIDDRHTGKFGDKVKARVIAGGAGWDQPVKALQFKGPTLSAAVVAATAAEVGEIATDLKPSALDDYYRMEGPASQILAGRDWYVEPTTGITLVDAPRIPIPTNPLEVEVLDWDPGKQLAIVASDGLLLPGMLLVDPVRIGAPIMVRDVEQTWSDAGARAKAWCVPLGETPDRGRGAAKLLGMIQSIARETSKAEYLTAHVCRVGAYNPLTNKVTVQPVDMLNSPLPKVMIEVPIAPGIAGYTAQLAPASLVLVAFQGMKGGADPESAYVCGFVEGDPLEIKLNATIRVAVGEGLMPVMKATPALLAWISAVTTALNGLAPGSAVLPADMVSIKLFTD